MNKSILIISDTHIPYHHPDLIPFLKDLKEIYKPDRVIHIGDEVDILSLYSCLEMYKFFYQTLTLKIFINKTENVTT